MPDRLIETVTEQLCAGYAMSTHHERATPLRHAANKAVWCQPTTAGGAMPRMLTLVRCDGPGRRPKGARYEVPILPASAQLVHIVASLRLVHCRSRIIF